MATLVPSSSNEHEAVLKATAVRYFKGVANETMRKRLVLAMMERHGVVEKNADSFACVWAAEMSQPEISQYASNGDLDFTTHDALQQYTVDTRSYIGTDRLTKNDQLINKGPSQIDNLYKNKSERLHRAGIDNLNREVYIDGYASGNEKRLIGLESALGDDGNTVATDIIANPSDSYGGQSTALGNITGSWSSNLSTSPNGTLANDWPYGRGDSEYDWNSPKLVNYSSTAWTGQTGWGDNCGNVLRFASNVCMTLNDDRSCPYVHVLASDLFNEFQDFLDAKTRIAQPHPEAADMGFHDTINYQGAIVHSEFDVNAGEGYGLCPDKLELFTHQDELFVPDGPTWSIEKFGFLYAISFFGNMRLRPRFLAKYEAYA